MTVPKQLRVITQEGLEQLHRYKYQSGGYSTLDNLLNPWWEFCVTLVPMTVAPNVLTLTALLCLMLAYTVMTTYCYVPGSSEILAGPSWTYVLCAFLNFTYQTLDAIDGKQARRTKAGSPLGQLFDHGCDSVGCVLILTYTIICVRNDFNSFAFVFMFALMVPFFLAQWEEHHTHTIRTHVGWIGVTEGQLISHLAMLSSGVFGTEFWIADVHASLSFVPADLLAWNQLVAIMVLTANMFLALNNFSTVLGKKGPSAFVDLIPLAVMLISCVFVKDTVCYEQAPLLCFMTAGAVFSHLTTQMIVCNVTHTPFSILQPTAWLFPLIVVNAYTLVLDPIQFLTLWFLFSLGCIARYILVSISQITETLGIYCLSLGARPAGKQNVPDDVLLKAQ